MGWKDWSYVKKGVVVGIIIWIVLIILYNISGVIVPCEPSGMEGDMCTNSFQDSILGILLILGFPALLIGGTPNMSTAGPVGVGIFYIRTLICFALWGALLGWIIKKIKKK